MYNLIPNLPKKLNKKSKPGVIIYARQNENFWPQKKFKHKNVEARQSNIETLLYYQNTMVQNTVIVSKSECEK